MGSSRLPSKTAVHSRGLLHGNSLERGPLGIAFPTAPVGWKLAWRTGMLAAAIPALAGAVREARSRLKPVVACEATSELTPPSTLPLLSTDSGAAQFMLRSCSLNTGELK